MPAGGQTTKVRRKRLAAKPKQSVSQAIQSGPSVVKARPIPRVSGTVNTRTGSSTVSSGPKRKVKRIPVIHGRANVPVKQFTVSKLLLGPGGSPKDYNVTKSGKRVVAITEQRPSLKASSAAAPVLTALDQTTRPLHAIAAGSDALITGKNPAKAALKGLQNKDRTTFSTVLKHLGAPKAVQAAGGFAADVGLDPTTYLTVGTASVAKKAAVKASEDAAKAAKAAGMGEAGQATVARAAVKKVVRKAGSGVTVKLAGHAAPGVTEATAAVGRTLRKVKPQRVTTTVRRAGQDVNPRIRPEGVSAELHGASRQAARTARATQQRGVQASQASARAIRTQIGEDNYAKVIDAIETRQIKTLPAELREPAIQIRSANRHMRRTEVRAGIAVPKLVTAGQGFAKEYVPREGLVEGAAGKAVKSGTPRVIKPDFAKGRTTHQPMSELRGGGTYVEDLSLLHANRALKSTRAVAGSNLNYRLAELGRPVGFDAKGHVKPFTIGDGEVVYHLAPAKGGSVLKEVDAKTLAAGKAPKTGRYFVLDKRVEERARNSMKVPERSTLGTGYDKVQGGFKRVATATPGFHVRNLVGDTQNAYLAQPGRTLPTNLVHGARAAHALSKAEAQAEKTLKRPADTGKGVTLPGGFQTYRQIGEEAAVVGGAQTGYIGRELPELAATGGKTARQAGKLKKIAKRPAGGKVQRAFQTRENTVRLATYIHHRKQGLSPEQAAMKVSDVHFDYAELTPFERSTARRVMPFYTWSSRNIPLQARSIVQKPGKYAAIEKAREEAGKAAGMDPNDPKLLEYDARNAGFPVKVGGKGVMVSAGLPFTDLNELPIQLPGKLAREYGDKFASLITPLLKNPVELKTNYSFFFRDALQRPQSPLVPAPSWASHLPADVKRWSGYTDSYVNKQTGKKGPGWYGKADYVAKMLPGAPNIAQNLMTQGNRKGQTTAEKVLGGALGVRTVNVDKNYRAKRTLNHLYDEMDALKVKAAALNQQGIHSARTGGHETPEYRKILNRMAAIGDEIDATKAKRGDPGSKAKVVKRTGLPALPALPGLPSLPTLPKP